MVANLSRRTFLQAAGISALGFGLAACSGGSSIGSSSSAAASSSASASSRATASVPAGEVAIDAEHFPDEMFRSYVLTNFDSDHSGGLSKSELADVTVIDVQSQAIESLQGVEYFTSLQSLNCSGNSLKSIDLSKNAELLSLECSYNELTKLDVSANPSLEQLLCSGNQLKALDLSQNLSLHDLGCSSNSLKSLDLSQNVGLWSVACYDNPLTELDVSQNTTLETLDCDETLSVTGAGEHLDITVY